MAELLKRFNDQVVDGHPNRPTPIRITTKHGNRTIGRAVAKVLSLAAFGETVGALFIGLREGSYPKGREELILVKESFTDTPQAIFWHQGIQNTIVTPVPQVGC